jgi:hypothetical protein
MGGWGTTYKFLCQPVGAADDKGTHRVSGYCEIFAASSMNEYFADDKRPLRLLHQQIRGTLRHGKRKSYSVGERKYIQ